MLRILILVLVLMVSGAAAATFRVTKVNDSNDGVCNADCSFREAVGAANLAPTDDVVQFAIPSAQCPDFVCVVRLPPDGQVLVGNNGALVIQGNGWFRTVISTTGGQTVLLINNGSTNLTVNDLRLTGGYYPGSNAVGAGFANYGTTVMNRVWVDHNAAYTAHGIYNNGTLTLNDCNVWANGRNTGSGAGIYNNTGAILNVSRTSIVGNFASSSIGGGDGGGIINGGTVTAENSTIAENYGWFAGGGISNYATVNLQNVTLVGNAAGGPSGLFNSYNGVATTNTRNSVIARNVEYVGLPYFDFGPDSYIRPGQGFVNSYGNNIVGNCSNSSGTACGFTNGSNGDSTGTSAAPVDPVVSPVGLYGGNSFSQLPLTTSPLLNGGNNCVANLSCGGFNPTAALAFDQRGAARSGTVEIGAVEINPAFVASLPVAYINVAYTLTLVPNSGTFSYGVIGGSVPDGMNFANAVAAADGSEKVVPSAAVTLSGTPTVAGLFNFTVRISDGTNFADVNYSIQVLGPTAAGLSLGGKVVTAKGGGIGNVTVSLTDSRGKVQYARTNAFGTYAFESLNAGESYVVSVISRRYVFAEPSRMITLADSIADLDFVSE